MWHEQALHEQALKPDSSPPAPRLCGHVCFSPERPRPPQGDSRAYAELRGAARCSVDSAAAKERGNLPMETQPGIEGGNQLRSRIATNKNVLANT